MSVKLDRVETMRRADRPLQQPHLDPSERALRLVLHVEPEATALAGHLVAEAKAAGKVGMDAIHAAHQAIDKQTEDVLAQIEAALGNLPAQLVDLIKAQRDMGPLAAAEMKLAEAARKARA